MHWYGHFRAAFFRAWTEAGLPDPEDFVERYRGAIKEPHGVAPPAPSDAGPLHPEIMARVYGFGEVVGGAIGRLLGLDATTARQRSEWPARFNLGISLFDYVCDEAGRGHVLGSVEPFAAFEDGAAAAPAKSLRPAEVYLVSLATDLIADLRTEADDRLAWEPMFAAMYQAERAVADWQLGGGVDLLAVRNALQSKSSEPVALMAGWMALGDSSSDIDAAVRIGRAIGNCVWIVDDAADLWTDIDAANWNLFLVRAASHEQRLITDPRTPLRDVHLNRVLVESGAAEKESAMVVEELVDSLSAVPDVGVAEEALGLVAASLAVWSPA
jgi:hypothetical protein